MEFSDEPPLSPGTVPTWAKEGLSLLEQNADHPMHALFEAYGVTWQEERDDAFERIAPRAYVFKFTSGDDAAYVWTKAGTWHVSPWFPQGPGEGRTVETVSSFRMALDRLKAHVPRETF